MQVGDAPAEVDDGGSVPGGSDGGVLGWVGGVLGAGVVGGAADVDGPLAPVLGAPVGVAVPVAVLVLLTPTSCVVASGLTGLFAR